MKKWCFLTVLYLVFAAVTVGLHHRGFSAPYYMDSSLHLTGKTELFAAGSLGEVVRAYPTRAVSMATFLFDYRVDGLNPYHVRLVNALLLAATSLAVFLLISVMWEIPAVRTRLTAREQTAVALAVAFMFAVHSVHSLVVLYAIQRMALLSCLFYVCGVLSYVSTRLGKIRRRGVGYALCAVCFALGLLSKENAITLPVVWVLAEFAFFTGAGRSPKRLVVMCLGPALLLGAILVAVQMVFRFEGTSGMVNLISSDYDATGLSLYQVILSETVVFFRYLSMLATPFLVHIGLLQPVVVSQSPIDPPVTLAAMGGLLAVLVGGVVALRYRPLSGFGILSVVLVLVPEMVLDPKFLCLPYRVVLPAVPFLLVVADLAVAAIECGRARDRLGTVRVLLALAFVAWVGMTAAATLAKAKLWADPILQWGDVVRGYPPQGVPHVERFARSVGLNNLGVAFLRRGRLDEAVRVYEEALRVRPESAVTNNNLGTAKVAQGRVEESLGYFRKAIEIQPRVPEPYVNLGDALMRLGRYQEAKAQLERAVAMHPTSSEARVHLGMALSNLGLPAEAQDHLRRALEIDPKSAAAHNQLGMLSRMMNDPAEAMRRFSLALALEPDMPEARQNLADTLFQLGRFDLASAHYRAIVEKEPDNCEARNNLGVAYMELKRFPEAVEQLRHAAKIRPDLDDIRANLEAALKASQQDHESFR
ncbi:MAG: tetratricopeptide repeat protein [Thermodesulfobacteriota bacterium]